MAGQNIPTTQTMLYDIWSALEDAPSGKQFKVSNPQNFKAAAKVLTATNIDLSAPGATLDGVAMSAGDRFVANGQTDTTENGIYVYNGASSAATRSTDANTGAEIFRAVISIDQGTSADTMWILTNNTVPTLGVTALAFASLGTTYVGTANRITVTGTVIDISAAYVGQASIVTVGALTSGSTGAGFTVALSVATVSGLLLGANGGTGVANTGKTITVSGNVTIGSTTNTVAFVTSGNTSVALPTSGTLATTTDLAAYLPLAGGTLTGQLTSTYNSAVSSPAQVLTGTWFTGGTTTTTKPHVLIEPTGTTSTGWSTSGTGLGVNAASGFVGNILHLKINGSDRFTATDGVYTWYNSGGNPHARVNNFGDGGISSVDGLKAYASQGIAGNSATYTWSGAYPTENDRTFSISNDAATQPTQVILYGSAHATKPNIIETYSNGFVFATKSSTAHKATNHAILFGATTDAATAVELTTTGTAGSGTTNRIVVPNNTTLSIVLNIGVKQSGSANAKQMLRQVVITNNGGTTALSGTPIALGTDTGDAGLATVTCTITANNTDDCLKIEVNGVAATNLKYTCFVVSTEVLYS